MDKQMIEEDIKKIERRVKADERKLPKNHK
jgi:hypothetical protein